MPDKKNKLRQHVWRQAQKNKGRQQRIYWLDTAIANELDKRVAGMGGDKQDAINTILKSLLATDNDNRILAQAAENVALPNEIAAPTAEQTSQPERQPKIGGRYMTPQLENYILDLREQGLSLNAVADRLANEGHLGAKGKYGTGAISKAEQRVKRRREAK